MIGFLRCRLITAWTRFQCYINHLITQPILIRLDLFPISATRLLPPTRMCSPVRLITAREPTTFGVEFSRTGNNGNGPGSANDWGLNAMLNSDGTLRLVLQGGYAVTLITLLDSNCVCSAVALADTPFRNLDFESASVPVPTRTQGQPDHNVPISRGLPGWSGFRGTDSVSTVWYDDVTTGNANIDILDRISGFGSQIIDGNFSILLQPGAHGIEERVSVSISQFGTVPA